MRILQVTTVYFPELQFGGPPQKIHNLSRKLIQYGNHVEVLTFHSEQPHLRQSKVIEGVKIRYLPWFGYVTKQIPLAWQAILMALEQADIVTFLVAHKEFKNLDIESNLDFCGVSTK